jgi:hypothetical protein
VKCNTLLDTGSDGDHVSWTKLLCETNLDFTIYFFEVNIDFPIFMSVFLAKWIFCTNVEND